MNDPQHIRRTETGGKQGLMGVAEGSIRQQDLFLLLHPFCQTFRPSRVQYLLRAFRQAPGKGLGHVHGRKFRFLFYAHISIAVHGNIRNIMQQLGAPVPAFREVEQLRRLVDKVSSIRAVHKIRMLQQVFQKSNVGLHAADTEFLQAPQHLGNGNFMGEAPGRGLNQQGIIIGSDHGTGKSVAGVQTDTHAAATAVGDELARIRHKVIQRVFRGNTALDGFAPDADLVLLRNPHFRTVHGIPFRDPDLALHDVDAGNGFRNRVLHLDTGVHFNKVELIVPGHQKLYRTRADVIHVFHQLHRRIADGFPQFRLHKGRRRHLHHLLVTALYGAVALEQMDDLALFVA